MSEYFSHDYDARDDDKIQRLIYDLGWEGYGLYWALIEMLYKNDGYLTYECERIAYALRTEHEYIAKIIHDYGLFEVQDGRFFSNAVFNRLTLRKARSEKARESANKRWSKELDANALRTHCEGNAKKESKEKEKEDIHGVFDEFWEDYHSATGANKVKKTDARERWSKMSAPQRRDAMQAIPFYAQSDIVRRGYPKEATNYLRQKIYEDFVQEGDSIVDAEAAKKHKITIERYLEYKRQWKKSYPDEKVTVDQYIEEILAHGWER